MALRRLGQLEEAAAAYREAIAQSAGFAVAHNNLAVALKELGRTNEALVACTEALRLSPEFAEAHGNHGNVLQLLGRIDHAVAANRKAVDLKPGFAAAYRAMGAVKSYGAADPDIARMTALADGPAVSDDDAIQLAFALGKALEDTGDYDRSFDCLVQGNQRKRRAVEFDIAGFEFAAECIIETFTAPLFDGLGGAGTDSDLPIFIVGMPRSGTTLVEQILGSHPDVHGAGELGNMDVLAAGLDVNGTDKESWRRLGDAYAEAIRVHAPDSPRITDKMPMNFRHIGLIHLVLPRAPIINVTRDPRDTGLSCFKTLFTNGVEFSYDLAELGRVFRVYERLMEHWRAALPGRVLDMAYEDVVADLDGTSRRLIDHCGLEWSDRCLDFHQTRRPVRTASAAQVRRPINDRSVGRWRHYEDHLAPLVEELK